MIGIDAETPKREADMMGHRRRVQDSQSYVQDWP